MSVDETSECVRTMLDKWLQHLTTCLGQDQDESSPLSPNEIYSPIIARKLGRKIAEGRVKGPTSFRLASCWPWRSGALITLTNKKGEGSSNLEVGVLTSKQQDSYKKIEILLHLKVSGLDFLFLYT